MYLNTGLAGPPSMRRPRARAIAIPRSYARPTGFSGFVPLQMRRYTKRRGMGDTCQNSSSTACVLQSMYSQGFAQGCVCGSCADCIPMPSGVAQAAANLANYTPVAFNPAPAGSGKPTNPGYNAPNNSGANPYAGTPAAVVKNADGSTSIVDQYGQTVYTGAAVASNPSLLSQVPSISGLRATWTNGGIIYQDPNATDPSCNSDTGVCGSYEIQGASQPTNAGWWENTSGQWIWTGPGPQPPVNPDQALAINAAAPPPGSSSSTSSGGSSSSTGGAPGGSSASSTGLPDLSDITGALTSTVDLAGFSLPVWGIAAAVLGGFLLLSSGGKGH